VIVDDILFVKELKPTVGGISMFYSDKDVEDRARD
jgi:hypothetical protein